MCHYYIFAEFPIFFYLRKCPKIPQQMFNNSHGKCMGKIVKIILTEDDVKYLIGK